MSLGTLASPRSPIWTDPFPKSKLSYVDSTKPGYLESNIPIQPSDNILVGDLSLLTPTKVKEREGWASVESESLPAENLVRMIKSEPAQYMGKVSPESTFGCHLVARKIGDIYDPKKKRCVRTKFVRNDYFGIIALEESKNRTLIAMDKDWVLPVINDYFEKNRQIGGQRSEMLREYLATLNPKTFEGTPYVRWGTKPQFTPRQDFKSIIDQLSIYFLHDPEIGYIGETDSWNQYDSSIVMVFAPVNRDLAESILTHTYRERDFYSAKSYLTIFNLLRSEARDFEYLYPVHFTPIQKAAVFSSEILLQHEIKPAFYSLQVSRKFPRLDPKVGCFATYLLAESTYYNFPMSWEDRTLVIEDCGYIQGQDLIKQFGQFLLDIRSQGTKFQQLPNYVTAKTLSSTTDVKCFPFDGIYYAAVPKGLTVEEVKGDNPFSEVELKGPLKSMRKFPRETKKYLTSLGYLVNKPDYSIDLDLGYRTYQQNNKKVTIYYYLTTHEAEIDVHQSDGEFSRPLFDELTRLLRSGFFFTQQMKNITSAYPGFIPGYQTINRNLNSNVEKALVQINTLSSV